MLGHFFELIQRENSVKTEIIAIKASLQSILTESIF